MNKEQKEAIPVNFAPQHPGIPVGAEFTIAGVKIVGPGRFITDCNPGEETRLVNSKRPSVFVLRGDAHD
jgi:hypothetical protein